MIPLLISIFFAGSAYAAPALPSILSYDLYLNGVRAQPVAVESRWSDPQTPGCEIFQFRKAQLLKQGEELDYLLERMNRSKPSRRELNELKQLFERQNNLERELKMQTLEVTARFAFSPDDPARSALEKRDYILNAQTPSLSWQGFNAAEPKGIAIALSQDFIFIHSSIYLGDVCEKPLSFLFSFNYPKSRQH
jgi:hypothetical protein